LTIFSRESNSSDVEWVDFFNDITLSTNTLSTNNLSIQSHYFLSTVENSSPLPVSLLDFRTQKYEEKVKISWKTKSEVNNDYFILERSKDGINWTRLSVIEGAGNSNNLLEYHIYDSHPTYGLNYYRLIQFDYDGTSETFGPIFIDFLNPKVNVNFNIFPNPNQGSKVSIQTEIEDYIIDLFDGTGLLVNSFTNPKVIDCTSLNDGVYFLNLKTNYSNSSKKLIIKKL
jgi:hypothetical protein